MKTPAFWRTCNVLSIALAPLSWLYQLGAWVDRACTNPQRAPLPVISVGNVTAGGAGKTPTTLALIPILSGLGFAPHILTRGYGGAARSAHRVTAHDDWHQVGDEALLLARTAPTWVGRDRLATATAAAQAGATIAVCDDAHQHHAIAKTVSLLVVDGAYGIGNGKCLPAGALREPLAEALARADAVVIIGDDAQNIAAQTSLPVFAAKLVPMLDRATVAAWPWLAFAGIGRPEKFFATLREMGAMLAATRAFADHHAYRAGELAALAADAERLGAQLITTEKDAVKLPADFRARVTALPVTLAFDQPAGLRDFLYAKLQTTP